MNGIFVFVVFQMMVCDIFLIYDADLDLGGHWAGAYGYPQISYEQKKRKKKKGMFMETPHLHTLSKVWNRGEE